MKNKKVLIDLHNHANYSQFADLDKDMSIDYDRIFSMLQKKAEQSNTDFVVAVTEHDNFSMTKEEFDRFRINYPNVKIVLGLEVNTDLLKITDGMFKRAHMLLYADMSSEKGINKWFSNSALKNLSTIKTWDNQSLSKKLFIAKNVFNKVLNLNITNNELATILVNNENGGFVATRNAFMNLVCDKLKNTHPDAYEALNSERKNGRDISRVNFFSHTFRQTGVTVNNFEDLIPSRKDLDFAPDIRVPMEEIVEIAKQTGGYIVLAHPEVVFNKEVTKESIKADYLYNNGDETMLRVDNLGLTDKIKLFSKLCAEKGAKLEGFELTRKAIRDPKKLIDILDFAKNNGFEISYGGDVHYTRENYNNELTNTDRTYKKIHFDMKESIENHNKKNNKKKKKKCKKSNYYGYDDKFEKNSSGLGRQLTHEVNHVSLYDKIMGKETDTLFEMTLNGREFKYEKKLKYDNELEDIIMNGLEQ